MKVLKWICFILVCLDVLSYIIEEADKVKIASNKSSAVGKFVGMCVGVAARVFVLCGTATEWLLV